MSEFIIPNDASIKLLECKNAFNALTEKEKLYVHYLSKASFYGGLIALSQNSWESSLIFVLLHKLFKSQTVTELKEIALQKCNFTKDEFYALLKYIADIMSNMGNYEKFVSRFIPNLPKEKFEKLVLASNVAQKEPEKMESLLSRCLGSMYSLEDKENQLSFIYLGKLSHFSKNLSRLDMENVTEFFKRCPFDPSNTRVLKTVDETGALSYVVQLGDIQNDGENPVSEHVIKTYKFKVTGGPYSKFFDIVNKYLLLAKKHASNEKEVKRIENCYHGSVSHDGFNLCLDCSQVIERYVRFVEQYRDFDGMRAEFEEKYMDPEIVAQEYMQRDLAKKARLEETCGFIARTRDLPNFIDAVRSLDEQNNANIKRSDLFSRVPQCESLDSKEKHIELPAHPDKPYGKPVILWQMENASPELDMNTVPEFKDIVSFNYSTGIKHTRSNVELFKEAITFAKLYPNQFVDPIPPFSRGVHTGFVAIINKAEGAELDNKITELDKVEFLPLLPWPAEYERYEERNRLYRHLVLFFALRIIPSGINIPNYDDIMQNEGFKNVTLGNIIHSITFKSAHFLNKEDQELLENYCDKSVEIQLIIHEGIGFYFGKLFQQFRRSLNFDIDKVKHLETNEKISSYYKDGETYETVFGSLNSPYEKCRLECIGLCLFFAPEILKIFGHVDAEAEKVMNCNWLDMFYKGLKSIKKYEPETGKWLEAICQARYVILQVCMEAGEDFINIEQIEGSDGNPDLLLSLDFSKIRTVGKKAIANFLRKLQLYKSTADITSATAIFDKYSVVTSPFLKYREIVLARLTPKDIHIQANTEIEDDKAHLISYELSPEDLVQSWMDRFKDEDVDDILEEIYEKDKKFLISLP